MRIIGKDRLDMAHYEKTYDEPEICPLCGSTIKPDELFFSTFKENNGMEHLAALYLCRHCYRIFTALHSLVLGSGTPKQYTLDYIGPKKFSARVFEENISKLSASFVKIYNQAKEAETLGLDEIAGIGYRKSLEFLIKDYLIHTAPDDADKIKGMELGNCIANKLSNEKLKAVASRCAWLGNDMTHYVQHFEDRDIKDMKNFIDAVVYWVSMELITEDALSMERAIPK